MTTRGPNVMSRDPTTGKTAPNRWEKKKPSLVSDNDGVGDSQYGEDDMSLSDLLDALCLSDPNDDGDQYNVYKGGLVTQEESAPDDLRDYQDELLAFDGIEEDNRTPKRRRSIDGHTSLSDRKDKIFTHKSMGTNPHRYTIDLGDSDKSDSSSTSDQPRPTRTRDTKASDVYARPPGLDKREHTPASQKTNKKRLSPSSAFRVASQHMLHDHNSTLNSEKRKFFQSILSENDDREIRKLWKQLETAQKRLDDACSVWTKGDGGRKPVNIKSILLESVQRRDWRETARLMYKIHLDGVNSHQMHSGRRTSGRGYESHQVDQRSSVTGRGGEALRTQDTAHRVSRTQHQVPTKSQSVKSRGNSCIANESDRRGTSRARKTPRMKQHSSSAGSNSDTAFTTVNLHDGAEVNLLAFRSDPTGSARTTGGPHRDSRREMDRFRGPTSIRSTQPSASAPTPQTRRRGVETPNASQQTSGRDLNRAQVSAADRRRQTPRNGTTFQGKKATRDTGLDPRPPRGPTRRNQSPPGPTRTHLPSHSASRWTHSSARLTDPTQIDCLEDAITYACRIALEDPDLKRKINHRGQQVLVSCAVGGQSFSRFIVEQLTSIEDYKKVMRAMDQIEGGILDIDTSLSSSSSFEGDDILTLPAEYWETDVWERGKRKLWRLFLRRRWSDLAEAITDIDEQASRVQTNTMLQPALRSLSETLERLDSNWISAVDQSSECLLRTQPERDPPGAARN
ncbi:hypothetical protein M231_03940 [Tremella mesenterica]|uniref:Uncharacterized protein n=1 Tax=Tremella mesenterica TaxID=5217 RepID=A0A4Q1BLU5_TREME|nr:uncharacterized protein TREMEDRAFT_64821 [Tremella mesenterica DSM 1558]EIW66961.1 hypothetical protein TREMEDRAFT_64821 [Tremella mesenterica DSM 1558]RXK38764.1 hypothetical protein M231_03940 [Tremella mesenterica]